MLCRAYMHLLHGESDCGQTCISPRLQLIAIPATLHFSALNHHHLQREPWTSKSHYTASNYQFAEPMGRQKSPKGSHFCCKSIRAMCRHARATCVLWCSGVGPDWKHQISYLMYKESVKMHSSQNPGLALPHPLESSLKSEEAAPSSN